MVPFILRDHVIWHHADHTANRPCINHPQRLISTISNELNQVDRFAVEILVARSKNGYQGNRLITMFDDVEVMTSPISMLLFSPVN